MKKETELKIKELLVVLILMICIIGGFLIADKYFPICKCGSHQVDNFKN